MQTITEFIPEDTGYLIVLYMFLKNYKYLESPDKIFKYIQDQYTFIKNKIQEIE